MDWQRATTDTQKELRKKEIFEATLFLFKEHGYDNVSFNMIAKHANFTKSNMYRYFSSKEDIFLSIFGEMFKTWQKEYVLALKDFEENAAHNQFAQTWVHSYLDNPEFLDLIPILFISLERNSSYDQLFTFKEMSKDLLFEVAMEVKRVYPSLDIDGAFQVINTSFAITCNFWAANFQNESIRQIYENDEFKLMKPDFEKDATASIELILRGSLNSDTIK